MSAHISPCGKYRYSLRRGTDCEKLLFIGVNPSTADAEVDDATVRKWKGFSQRWGYGGFTVANLFAYRATDVDELSKVDDPHGHLNLHELHRMVSIAGLIVPCWGSSAKLTPRLRAYVDCNVRPLLRCFGLTKSGDPKHPLMLPYSTEMKEYKP